MAVTVSCTKQLRRWVAGGHFGGREWVLWAGEGGTGRIGPRRGAGSVEQDPPYPNPHPGPPDATPGFLDLHHLNSWCGSKKSHRDN